MSIDQTEARAWAQADEGALDSFKGVLWYLWYQKRPKLLGAHFTILGLFLGLLRFASVVGIASSPFWIEYYTTKKVDWENSLIFTALITIFMMYNWLNDKYINNKNTSSMRRAHDQNLAVRDHEAVKSLLPLVQVGQQRRFEGQKNQLVVNLLNCIEQKTRHHVNVFKEDYFQVSLLLFSSDGQTISIKNRAHPTRPLRESVEAVETAAYYVAQAKKEWKAIHDLKRGKIFPYSGLSRPGAPPYRSILMVPMFSKAVVGGEVCKGMITVDCAVPYEFWGPIAHDLAVKILPYSELINLLLDSSYGMKVTDGGNGGTDGKA